MGNLPASDVFSWAKIIGAKCLKNRNAQHFAAGYSRLKTCAALAVNMLFVGWESWSAQPRRPDWLNWQAPSSFFKQVTAYAIQSCRPPVYTPTDIFVLEN